MTARVRTLLVGACFLLAARAAEGQPSEASRAAAVALFDQAEQLMAYGDFAAACPKLAESNRLDPQLGALLHLANCYEKVGRLASAWAGWRDAAEIAQKRGDAREQTARDRAAALAPKLSKLVVEVPATSDLPALELRRDGVVVPRSLWGVEIPVDVGEHVFEASAPGKKKLTAKVTVAQDGVREVFKLDVLEDEPSPAGAVPARNPPEPVAPPLPAAPRTDVPRSTGDTQRTLGWISGGLGVVGIGAGVFFELRRWGKNEFGQLGDGSTGAPKASPVQVAALGADTVEVGASGDHTCARKTDGTLWCWGKNDLGQLGDGTVTGQSCDGNTECKPTPVQVTALGTAVADVAVGSDHTCALKTDGTLWCWGSNQYGQLGDGTTVTPKASPVQVALPGSSVAQLALGSTHTCALETDGTLWCWGYNSSGQLGDGTKNDSPSPKQAVSLGTETAQVALGGGYSCVRKTDGTLWCWGNNADGQLGDGTQGQKTLPVQVASLGTAVADVRAGIGVTCVRKTDGTAWCWGRNASGQVGDGTTVSPKLVPVNVAALGANVAEIGGGTYHNCGRKTDGTLWCWGGNAWGQAGDGTTVTPKLTPVQVASLGTSVAKLDRVGFGAVCARTADQWVWCWGSNALGQLGTGTLAGEQCGTVACQTKPVKVLLGCP